jgi:hypothetical protein
LHAEGGVLFRPVEKVLLIFSTEDIDQGAVITKAFTSGILLDLTRQQKRTVTYDRRTGWGGWPEGVTWATKIGMDENIVPHLIEKPTSLEIESAEESGSSK